MEPINNFSNQIFNTFDEGVNEAINNKYIFITLVILILLFGSLTASRLARNILYLFDHPLSRLLTIGFIYYISTKNVPLAILMLTAMVITMNTLNKHRNNVLLISILRNNITGGKPNRRKINKLKKLLRRLSKLLKMRKNKVKKLTPKIKALTTKATTVVNSLGDVTKNSVMELIKAYELEKSKNKVLSDQLSESTKFVKPTVTSSASPQSTAQSTTQSSPKSSSSLNTKPQIIFPKINQRTEKFIDYSNFSLF
jgi:hypothetical protein